MIRLPSPTRFSRRFVRVWQRNLSVYRKTWKISFLPPLLEPLLYLLAFGVGLAVMVGTLSHAGREISYLAFIAPALLSVAIMYNAFFETTYNSFVRMYYQKTFDAMLATPLNLEEIILGELVWAATKSLIATLLMGTVISAFGLLAFPASLWLLPLALLGGLAFAALGMICTGLIPNIETFNVPIFLIITPMFLFSGTFFPLANLPSWAQMLAQALPLTHLVALARACALHAWQAELWWSLAYLLLFTALAVPLAIALMVRRLIH
ncbi:ABC transporter permease [Geoalkalibacter halelectricus]|uniref:Transport permease protein n=1 Tax=Geoalkalibacter halelectricus TaxID=2847045 RepID=A0ABY5ZRW2_9BACT|nr:ABC transporter permease [Geoalkalibacter halelectricus]MDO3378721.1 ABC transporter permease [Geoalkalibacter halelectricus]UWZ79971.1 ABC transporter permease [Geoalkalibacter halelectricus]